MKQTAVSGPGEGKPSAQTEAIRLFLCVCRMHHCEVERRVSNLGIHHSQHRMLMYLAHMPSGPSQRELAEALSISPAAVTATLKGLEKEGYVERCTTDEDNRRHRVTITELGRRKVEESHAIFDSVDVAMLRGLSEEEIAGLTELLRRMRANLRQEDPPEAPEDPGAPDKTERKCST